MIHDTIVNNIIHRFFNQEFIQPTEYLIEK